MASESAVMSEGRTVVVMANGSADYQTITDALRECGEGDTILVKIGRYDEKVVLEKNLTIMGDPSCEVTDIVVTGGAVCKKGGTIKGISITDQVEVRGGDVTIEGCDISEGFDGVKVGRDSNPTIVRNSIHHARQGGDCIYVAEGGKALIEDNEIHSARVHGIHINGADVVVRRNRIHDCHFGVFFRKRGKGTVEGNMIQDCATFGIYITQGSDPVVERNNISYCQIHGIMVSQEGMGQLRENMCNGSLAVKRGCVPQLESNQVLGKFENENIQMADQTSVG